MRHFAHSFLTRLFILHYKFAPFIITYLPLLNFKNITEFSLPISFKFNVFENANFIFVYKNYLICESSVLSFGFGKMS